MVGYAATVTLSACLLFLVQPLIAKIILPWFGGASSVWVTTLLFFQVCLLCGYGYAHLLTKLSARRQFWIHCTLLLTSCLLLPIVPAHSWRAQHGDPAFRILLLLAATVGLPCFVLSATSPLLQAWYVKRFSTRIPLWLFALSNFGSLAALLSFPFLLEPTFDAHSLALAWSFAFFCFAACCAWIAWQSRDLEAIGSHERSEQRPPSAMQMLLWIIFAACGSALLGAATTQLSTNIAPIPLLWVVPLAIYLLTFIVNFRSRPIYRRKLFFAPVVAAIMCLAWLYANSETYQDIRYVIPLYLLGLFVICTACHGELALRAPAPAFLTRFYLLIALGGALGGAFVSLLSPLLFDSYLEVPVLLFVIAELMVFVQWRRKGASFALWPFRGAMIVGLLALGWYLLRAEEQSRAYSLEMKRNFYGALRVREYIENAHPRRSLTHGTIRHGYQFTEPALHSLPTSYYSETSGVGRTLLAKDDQISLRVGVIGLGVGTLLSYARPSDHYFVYEINPDVLAIAQSEFTYLSAAQERRADIQIFLGDARLTLEDQAAMQFDVLAVDAFSSDAIPVHLLTNEAFAIYARHLKPNGVLAIHISNKYLDLAPICEQAARQLHRVAKLVPDPATALSDASNWVLITADERLWQNAAFADARVDGLNAIPAFKGWTDQYSSMWTLLKLRAPQVRVESE